MKTLGFLVSAGAACLLTTSLGAAPFPAAQKLVGSTGIQTVAYNGDPYSGRHRAGGGGGRRHKESKAGTAAVPSLKGTSPEEADKAYRQKYGF